ncbi:MAG TPA: class I SAM-dependent methyltransferase [Steroidobacteraceae bacterium]|nr:class I SAM-dependent methyltransferase [Steroidobacteraceae bacterium]
MKTSAAHYATHLGPIYSWMLGDIDAAFARSAAEIDDLKLPEANHGAAVDLGAGLGLHARPLARRGFHVTAIDSCQVLLDELRARSETLAVTTVNADLVDYRAVVKEAPRVVLCMGDTLTHLPTLAAVESLLKSVADGLARGGVFAATFRDYATRTLEGDKRFILVRADADRILTCFLEYAEHEVTVHDVLTEREHDQWRQKISSYLKLRLAPEWVESTLMELGLKVRRDTSASGMVRIVAVKT